MVEVQEKDKGEEIRFVGGTYAGRTGWQHAGKEDTAKMTHVIIEKEGEHLKGTRVRKENVRNEDKTPPANYEAAMLNQQRDIEVLLRQVTKKIAKCGLYDSTIISMVFTQFMDEAIQTQRDLGYEAQWHWVDFTPPDVVQSDAPDGQH